MLSINLFGQTNLPIDSKTSKITYKNIIETENDSIENITILKQVLNGNEKFSALNEKVENGRLIFDSKGKLTVYYNLKSTAKEGSISSLMNTKDKEYGYVEFDVSFMISGKKLGYKFTNFTHKNDKGPKHSCGELEQVIGNNTQIEYWNGYKEQTDKFITAFISDLENALKNKNAGEDW